MDTKITITLPFTSDGHIDEAAAKEAFFVALATQIVGLEANRSTVAVAVNALYDEHRGEAFSMRKLCAMVFPKLNATPDQWADMTHEVEAYIHANAQGDNSLFVITRGPGNGTRRRADIVAPVPKPINTNKAVRL